MSFGAGQLEVAGVASVLHIFTLGRKTVGAGGGGVTRSREHYSDARGGTRQSTLNRGSVGERGRGGAEKGLGSEGVHMRKLSINPPNYIKG